MIAKITDNGFWKGFVIILASLYILDRFLNYIMLGNFGKRKQKFDYGFVFLYSYLILYSILYYTRSSSELSTFLTMPFLLAHTIFWQLVYTSKIYNNNFKLLLKDIFIAFLVGFIFLFIYTLINTNFVIISASTHNLAEILPGLASDLDVPFLALATISLVVSRVSLRSLKMKSNLFIKYTFPATIMFTISLFALWLSSRRGPMLVVLFMIVIANIPNKLRSKALILLILLPLIPLVWEYVGAKLVFLSQSSIINKLISRNSANDYFTATNRLIDWTNSFHFLFDFQPRHLIGYGGVPWKLIAVERTHMHNMILTLFFDAGLITIFAVLLLIFATLKRFIFLIDNFIQPIVTIKALFLYYSGFLILSSIEPTLRSYSLTQMVFLIITVTVLNYYRTCKADFSLDKIN